MIARIGFFLLTIIFSIPSLAQSNVLVNGGFGEGPALSGDFITLPSGSNAIHGWTVTRATIDYCGPHFRPPRGDRSIDLDGTPGFGGIKQTFRTNPGQLYLTTFDLAGNPEGPPATKVVRVAAAGQSTDFSHDASLNWTHKRWEFIAVEESTTLEFYSLDTENGNFGPLLANVSVSAQGPRKIFANAIFETNLIFNGDAEVGPGSQSGNEILTPPGWTTTSNFTAVEYGRGEFPKPNEPGPPNRGKNFFAGGPDNAKSSANQIIDVSAAAPAIDATGVNFNAQGYLGGWQSQEDRADLTTKFLDANGQLLQQIILGPVTAEDRQRKTGLFPVSRSGTVPGGTRLIEFELEMIRAEGSYNDGYADSLSFQLKRPGFLESIFRTVEIWLTPDRPSGRPGEVVSIEVTLGYSRDAPADAKQDVPVHFEAKGAVIEPKEIAISRGARSAKAEVTLGDPGRIELTASAPGFRSVQVPLASCDVGDVDNIAVDSTRRSEMADGSGIGFTVELLDNQNRPVTNRKNRLIGFNPDPDGVGQLQHPRKVIPGDQCSAENSISSFEAGVATIEINAGDNLTKKEKFSFTLPLSIRLFILVLGGGVVGAFIRAAHIWPTSRRWAHSRWVAFLTSGTLTGLVLFLLWYYALRKVTPNLAGNDGMGFLLGAIGGYLGPAAMERAIKVVFPFAKQ
jgi:choice-of-anchor C domain-containing protein